MAHTVAVINFSDGAEEHTDFASVTLADGREVLVFPDGTFQVWTGSNCLNEELLEESNFFNLPEECNAT